MRILRAVLGAVAIVVLALSWVDPDLWGHVRFGLDIIATGEIRGEDAYSFTSDVPWVNHEWLAELAFAAAFLIAGSAGLILLKLSLALGTIVFSMRGVWQSGRDWTVQDTLLGVLIAGIWIRIYVIRPQLFSLVCFAGLMWIVRGVEDGAVRRLAWLPLVFALWVNLHGGWIVGAGVLGLWAITTALTSPAVPKRAIVLAGLTSAGATLLNPYGAAMWGFLAETVRPERPWIDDWRPLLATASLLPFWLPVAGTAVFGLWRGRRVLPWSHALIVVALGAASLRVSRLDAFFAIATITLLGPVVATARSVRPSGMIAPGGTRAVAVPVAATVLIVAALATPVFRCVRMEGLSWLPEAEAVPAMRAGGLKGRMITWFGWGQYAIWHLSPAVKVSFDGRRETVYSDRFGDNHVRLYWAPGQVTSFLDGLDADFAWLPRELPLAGFLEAQGWIRIFEGPRSLVLSRRARKPLPQLAEPRSARLCFPGP